MPVRRSAALRVLRSLSIFALACTACACTEPPAGMHVVVTMKDADFDDDHLFDHLTVTARIGERRADACLYPADAVDREVPVEAPSPYACADLRTQPWMGAPTAASWALASAPRTINVDANDGEEVEITVTGGFGGRLGTVTGTGKLVASPSYPELTVTLARAAPLFQTKCDVQFDISFPPKLDTKLGLCEADAVECPIHVFDQSPKRSQDAVRCLDGGTARILNGEGLIECIDDMGESIVWHSATLPKDLTCIRVFVQGQFVRCKSGDPLDPAGCAETTDCTPKPVGVWSRIAGEGNPIYSGVELSCLPPTAVPITWSVRLDLPGDLDPKKTAYLGLTQSKDTTAGDACFLDVKAVAWTSNDCAP